MPDDKEIKGIPQPPKNPHKEISEENKGEKHPLGQFPEKIKETPQLLKNLLKQTPQSPRKLLKGIKENSEENEETEEIMADTAISTCKLCGVQVLRSSMLGLCP